ncbi:hypothetical protein KTS45_11070 [Halomicroarcula limicola]|uniref:Uncharacterized protein n=1 Tax=Haloarcula limicola TaxID=1429915 RepID=A0A8J7Y577_9EURY|nr:hypothetical protein [Halomicroarcula limicola]MBV0924740.1 hypothetical protein [Halomicroarcula limicola]
MNRRDMIRGGIAIATATAGCLSEITKWRADQNQIRTITKENVTPGHHWIEFSAQKGQRFLINTGATDNYFSYALSEKSTGRLIDDAGGLGTILSNSSNTKPNPSLVGGIDSFVDLPTSGKYIFQVLVSELNPSKSLYRQFDEVLDNQSHKTSVEENIIELKIQGVNGSFPVGSYSYGYTDDYIVNLYKQVSYVKEAAKSFSNIDPTELTESDEDLCTSYFRLKKMSILTRSSHYNISKSLYNKFSRQLTAAVTKGFVAIIGWIVKDDIEQHLYQVSEFISDLIIFYISKKTGLSQETIRRGLHAQDIAEAEISADINNTQILRSFVYKTTIDISGRLKIDLPKPTPEVIDIHFTLPVESYAKERETYILPTKSNYLRPIIDNT